MYLLRAEPLSYAVVGVPAFLAARVTWTHTARRLRTRRHAPLLKAHRAGPLTRSAREWAAALVNNAASLAGAALLVSLGAAAVATGAPFQWYLMQAFAALASADSQYAFPAAHVQLAIGC